MLSLEYHQQDDLIQLPKEVLLLIFRFLGPHDLCSMQQVCRYLLEIGNMNDLWHSLILALNLGYPYGKLSPSMKDNFRIQYQSRLRRERRMFANSLYEFQARKMSRLEAYFPSFCVIMIVMACLAKLFAPPPSSLYEKYCI